MLRAPLLRAATYVIAAKGDALLVPQPSGAGGASCSSVHCAGFPVTGRLRVSDRLDGHARRMLGQSPEIREVSGHDGPAGLGNRCDEGVDGRTCTCPGS
jgi:hypothetical protein